jgi:hypothetical protein
MATRKKSKKASSTESTIAADKQKLEKEMSSVGLDYRKVAGIIIALLGVILLIMNLAGALLAVAGIVLIYFGIRIFGYNIKL